MSSEKVKIDITEAAERLKSCYQRPSAALVPLLFEVQKRDGCVSDKAELEVARLLGISHRLVHEAVTFYPLLFQKPTGKHLIQFCHNISCFMSSMMVCLMKEYTSVFLSP